MTDRDDPRATPGDIPVIAIDGPSGAGKGTVAAAIADRLGWHLLDSGALYRVVALVARRQGVDLDDGPALADLIAELDLAFSARGVAVAGVDETLAIRADAVGSAASMVAAVAEVRSALLATQRRFRKRPGLVADGRDMGTVVFPDATAKIFLTASVESRAQRRLLQLEEMRRLNETAPGGRVSRRSQPIVPAFDALLRELEARDARDRERTVSPLVPAPDAHTVDTTAMTVDEVVSAVMAHVGRHVPHGRGADRSARRGNDNTN